MVNQIVEQGTEFELNGVKCRILSVGAHEVDGEPAGYSYSFRPVEDIEHDAEVARVAEEKRAAEDHQRAAQEEEAAKSENAVSEDDVTPVENTSEGESENSPEGSDEKTTQNNGLPLN